MKNNKKNFTSGPWILADENELCDVKTGGAPFGIWNNEESLQVAKICTDASPQAIIANAYLIEAAPEMYAQILDLRNFVGVMQCHCDEQGGCGRCAMLYDIDRTLAKARGE